MIKSRVVSVPNALVFIASPEATDIPIIPAGSLSAHTDGCLAVGTLIGADGETTITLAEANDRIPDLPIKVFDGTIECPDRVLEVSTVAGDVLLATSVATDRVHLEVYANDPREPDEIVVVTG